MADTPELNNSPDADAMLAGYQYANPDVLSVAGAPMTPEEIASTPVGDIMHPTTAYMVVVLAKAGQAIETAQSWIDAAESPYEKASSELRLNAAQGEYARVLADFEATLRYTPGEEPRP